MKKIEAIIQEEKLSNVVNALKISEVGGVTITLSRGIGAGERPVLRGARGTAKFEAAYNRIATIVTVVEDSKLETVVTAIMNAVSTGKAGDGKIFVTNVEEAFDIATKQSGKHIL
ncbi:MAG: P-II family nitrogen regulator [Candidatus Nitrosotenuis sp.]